jgi:hypothetical protein
MKERTLRAELTALIKGLKKDIGDEYRAYDDGPIDDKGPPSMLVTVGADARQWSYQTGDNSYSGGAYGYAHWAVVAIDRRSNSRAVADDMLDQLAELSADSDGPPICEEWKRDNG